VGLKVVEEKPDEGDLLVLGTFVPSEDLAQFSDPFDLTIDEGSEYVTVPGFGKIGRSGNGLLLFQTGKKGNTIVLLANTVDDLTTLLDTLSSGNLTGCVLQGNIGMCSIGVGGSFSDGSDTTGTPQSEGTLSGEATPTPTGAG